tara:strand:+ start:702 stop:818 length:117 start_codon:yes stop_codon:yes gene_type:complete
MSYMLRMVLGCGGGVGCGVLCFSFIIQNNLLDKNLIKM